jgi:hypothetical protein
MTIYQECIFKIFVRFFKSEIEKFSEKRKKSVEVNIEKVQKEIGKPNSIEKCIQHYNSRDRISLKEILDNTTNTVEMSALTFSVIKDNDLSLIERKLKKGIKFTFILPDRNSTIIDRHIDRYPSSKDFKEKIERSITELSNLKTKFKNNVTIKINITDNFDNSIILVDKNKPEKTFIKVESRPIWKSGIERGSDLVFREDDENNYSEWKKLYDDIFDSSKDYID